MTTTEVAARALQIQTADGLMDATAFHPAGPGPWPAVLFFMDGIGLRPALSAMAERLAAEGYYVLLPNLFYRAGAYEPFDPATVFQDEAARTRVMALVFATDGSAGQTDRRALVDFLVAQPEVASPRIGCLGYCLGGRFALLAAAEVPDHVVAALSIHGGRLIGEAPDSPHRQAVHMRAHVYLGIAEIDRGLSAEQREQLRAALVSAGVRFELEVYPGVSHGFAIPGLLVYDQAAAERHWTQVFRILAAELAPA